jgi:hypothetical protein
MSSLSLKNVLSDRASFHISFISVNTEMPYIEENVNGLFATAFFVPKGVATRAHDAAVIGKRDRFVNYGFGAMGLGAGQACIRPQRGILNRKWKLHCHWRR